MEEKQCRLKSEGSLYDELLAEMSSAPLKPSGINFFNCPGEPMVISGFIGSLFFITFLREEKNRYLRKLRDCGVRSLYQNYCIHQEPEESPDGTAPFSPCMVSAPPLFIICNDWYQNFDKIPETEVDKAIEKFAAYVKEVVEYHNEEQQQKRKVKNVEKDLNRHVQILKKVESRLHEPRPSSDKKI
ncbi:hypothetical protein KI387_032180 [Taxus chinensis]|uniref:DUF632 domain-containing protein n=1 Tax=Taxus chinensis TaxID=29808 RepID=A0AA38C1P9_TAXCH|nr:hypothetical protein KI387_032180 [Taxus chinensis]